MISIEVQSEGLDAPAGDVKHNEFIFSLTVIGKESEFRVALDGPTFDQPGLV